MSLSASIMPAREKFAGEKMNILLGYGTPLGGDQQGPR